MWDVDQALSRVFPLRPSPGRAAGVPPAPHVFGKPDEEVARPDVASVERPPVSWPTLVRVLGDRYPERFERLADALLDVREEMGVRVVLFASCQRAEGCSTLLMTLARALGARPWRTLVVDADLAAPTIGRQLALNPEVGLEEVVTEGRPLAEAIVESSADGLSFLSVKRPVAHPRAFWKSPGWPRLVGRLRREHDLVLIDGGPLFHGYGSSLWPPAVDAAVLVQNPAVTGLRALERARVLLENGGVPLLGLASTFTG